MDRLAAIPGVQSVGVVGTLPLDEGAGSALITTERIEASGAEPPMVRVTTAGGAYFQSMGIGLLAGRLFERNEELAGVNNVVVSRAAASLLWPGEDPLGKLLRPRNQQSWVTVVGVVEDVMLDNFRRESPEPMVYVPRVAGSPAYVLKSPRAASLGPEVRALLREVVPESPMYRVFTMEELAARSMGSLTFTMLMVGIAAGLALILGAVGLYGVLSYGVTRRTREIGVRMALGAEGGVVRRMVVAQGGRVALIGVAVGVLASIGLTRYLENLLFGVQPLDVLTFSAVSVVMVGVALLASYLPARRASLVDPVVALRAE
jgi:predicted permease